jgi:hypothetical protein
MHHLITCTAGKKDERAGEFRGTRDHKQNEKLAVDVSVAVISAFPHVPNSQHF